MNAFIFRSIIGIFFGAFIAVMTTSALIYFGGQSTIDGLLLLKMHLAIFLRLAVYCHTTLF